MSFTKLRYSTLKIRAFYAFIKSTKLIELKFSPASLVSYSLKIFFPKNQCPF